MQSALEQRNFEKVVAWNFHPEMLSRLSDICTEVGMPFEAVDLPTLGKLSDVIITITSAFEPMLKKNWIKPGCHIACMGTDTIGKQEVDAQLVAGATVFTDEVSQSISLGEAQHAYNEKLLTEADITPIGDVITGVHKGRSNNVEITLFDGTGVGLQDLAVASVAAEVAFRDQLAQFVTF